MLNSDEPLAQRDDDYSKQLDEEIDQLIADLREYMGEPSKDDDENTPASPHAL
jgi:hypothetical protein